MNIHQAAAFYYFGLLESEKLPKIALEAIVSGIESESLFLLASETESIMSTVGPLFERSIHELGLDQKQREEHSLEAAKYYADLLMAGKISIISFGLKVGSISNYKNSPSVLQEIYQNVVWHDECATEYGYPEDYKATKKECEEKIALLAKQLLST